LHADSETVNFPALHVAHYSTIHAPIYNTVLVNQVLTLHKNTTIKKKIKRQLCAFYLFIIKTINYKINLEIKNKK